MSNLLQIFKGMALALLITIVIESIPHFFLSPRRKWLSTGLLCNVLTNPMLNCLRILWYNLFPNDSILFFFTLILEFLILLLEGWFYNQLLHVTKRKGFLVSLLCNSLSFLIGSLIL